VVEQIDMQYGGWEIAICEGLQDEDVEMMEFAQEEVQKDAYVLGGMWYLNNWVLTSNMSEEQWKASTAIVGCGKSGQYFHRLRNSPIKLKPGDRFDDNCVKKATHYSY
jgi:hypothetical protein